MVSSCNLSDTGPSAYLPREQFFTELALEHHAINLSMAPPYDTVTLHTTRLMGDGSPVPGDVTYSVSSPNISVTDGVLKAEGPVAYAVVRATLTHGTITRTDSAIVSVIASAPDRLRDFGLRVPPGDSAKIEIRLIKMIPLIRESESGVALSTLLVHLVSSDTTVAKVIQAGNDVRITPRRPGRVMVSGSTFAFGVAWRDSLVFTGGWPLYITVPSIERFTAGSLTKRLDFVYPDLTIGVGGCVMWENSSSTIDLDVQFDDSSHVAAPLGHACAQLTFTPEIGGNIAPYRWIPYDGNPENAVISFFSGLRVRVFPVPGDFTYRSALHGSGGRVRVCDERNDTTCAPARIGSWY